VVEFEPYLYQIEDQAIPNRDLILGFLSSVYPHEERGKLNLLCNKYFHIILKSTYFEFCQRKNVLFSILTLKIPASLVSEGSKKIHEVIVIRLLKAKHYYIKD
jgi:hypothetical protein